MESYSCPDLKNVDFSKWDWRIKPRSKKGGKTGTCETIQKADDVEVEAPTFVVRRLTFNYAPKPASLPINKTRIRDGDAYTAGAYSSWEPLQMSAHLSSEDVMDGDLWKAAVDYETVALKYLWDNRVAVFPTQRPKLPAELNSKRFDYARLITDIGAPRDAVPDAPTKGIEYSVVGWGDAVDRAVVVYTGNAAYPERIGWATYAPKKAGPELLGGGKHTKFWLVLPNTVLGTQFIEEVPWTEDGELNTDSPVKRDAKGEPMWRKVGPQDVKKGSTGDVVLEHRALTTSDTTGAVNKKMVAKAIFFSLPQAAFVPEEESIFVEAPVTFDPPAESVASRSRIQDLLAAARGVAAKAVEEEGDDADEPEVPVAAASAEVAVAALRTPEGKGTKPSTVPGSFEHKSTKRGREQ